MNTTTYGKSASRLRKIIRVAVIVISVLWIINGINLWITSSRGYISGLEAGTRINYYFLPVLQKTVIRLAISWGIYFVLDAFCEMCMNISNIREQGAVAENPEADVEKPSTEKLQPQEVKKASQSSWKCPECDAVNPYYIEICSCGYSKYLK